MPRTTIRSEDITDSQVKTVDMAIDPTNASNLSSGSVPVAQLGNVPLESVEDDVAVLGFQVAAANDLAIYNLRDQIVDTFQDTSGVDASASTNEQRDATGKYWYGGVGGNATGGTITTHGSYTVHSFLSGTTNFVTPAAYTGYAVLMVAGGGGGGGYHAGGGGAGGVIQGTGWTLAAGTYPVVVGAGGAAKAFYGNTASSFGNAGSNTTFASQTALGGGGGGEYQATNAANPYSAGGAGASGGGACGGQQPGGGWSLVGGAGAQPAPTGQPGTGHGNPGGASSAGWTHSTGGGGGAGAPGQQAAYPGKSGDGGDGIQNDYRTGSNVYYGGGGGGGRWSGTRGEGGQGGGGAGTGSPGSSNENAGNGTANTGGGGGGMGGNDGTSTGGSGGSGIVVIRYTTGSIQAPGADLTLVSTATTAEAGTTDTGDVVMLYTPAVGTTTLNTDLKAYVSRDNGTTYTQATLVGKGSYSGTTQIASVHNLDISGQPAGTTMRWKVETLNQSNGVKETRINGMSLGWS